MHDILRETVHPAEAIDEVIIGQPLQGGALSTGHPIGASGGQLTTTIIRELNARHPRYGVATLCIGDGEAVATLLDVPEH